MNGINTLELQQELAGREPGQQLALLAERFPGRVVFSTSFSAEDQLISHWIFSQKINISVFTLDTGRLFPETYSTWNNTLDQYHSTITPYYPDAERLGAFIEAEGPNAFYRSPALRQRCCALRKVEPLQKALKGQRIWVTGIRAQHSPNRNSMDLLEEDPAHQLLKFHPLLHWTTEEVKQQIDRWNIPSNPLHEKGLISIGCAPCTRAVKPGEDFRAGRWWWEDESKKECGLHSTHS